MTLIPIIFFVINVILGFIDSRIIKRKKGIRHWLNGLVYTALVVAEYLFFERNLLLSACLFIERLIFFQISLSLFRRLKWYYVSAEPKAITDKLAKVIFGDNGKLMYAVYLAVFIGLLIKILI